MELHAWLIWVAVLIVLIGAYVWLFLFTRKRQKAFDEQYNAMKERRDIFVLSKKVTKERGKSRFTKYIRLKNYHVVGRLSLSQAVKGMQMTKMQTVTFQTTKKEYEKIQPNHKYRVDVAGNYIGFVVTQLGTKEGKKPKGKQGAASTHASERRGRFNIARLWRRS